MDEGNEGKRSLSGMEKLSLETNRRHPRDLLQMFTAINPVQLAGTSLASEEDESEEIELSLGLSLGGRFGVDKNRKLMRSSSIAGIIPTVKEDDAVAPLPVSNPALTRTSSLPVESAEAWRKRKELQMLRRMAAKRRRSEKQRNMKGEKEGEAEANLRGKIEREQHMAAANRALPPCGLPNWAAAARQALFSGGKVMGGGGPLGSVESQGGSSSGMSESESRQFQGSSSCGEASPSSIHSLQERSSQEAAGSSRAKGKENPGKSSAETESSSKRTETVERRGRETGLSSMEDMPCVFTQGDGPNGRRIEGILYKYGKGEEVRIMCICHGSFHSPAEFVRHAGGTDIAQPLKHIVVNPSATPFL
ncbi:ninja-family protein AFP2-like [Diospyros lotus]|uniref:ninja-family protein AFP2-like n=1 Tax=Diospyros lotus TaxID=55363 RepID=UPI00225A6AAD|nr:ninja-family protein AFP2-like [Diospyros lotus]